MRTLDPGPGVLRPKWEKECICTGAGNGDRGCGSQLLVEWDDLFMTCAAGDARDVLTPSAKSLEELAQQMSDAFERGASSYLPASPSGNAIFVTFRCHDCGAETDLLTMSPGEISRRGFFILPTKREWDQRMDKYRKV